MHSHNQFRAHGIVERPGLGLDAPKRKHTPTEDDYMSGSSGSDEQSEGQNDDEFDLVKYLHPVPKVEASALDRRLGDANKGMQLLLKMGYQAGTGLGLDGSGRVDPIPMSLKSDAMGLGKAEEEETVLSSTSLRTRELESEKIARETAEERLARENRVAKQAALASEIAQTLSAFACDICDKAYANVTQYTEHLNSYDHHHRKRFKEMQAGQRAAAINSGAVDRRREKERKREEKEMRRIGVAIGISATPIVAATSSSSTPSAPAKAAGFKKVGAAPAPSPSIVGSANLGSSKTAPAFRSSGYTVLDQDSYTGFGTRSSAPISLQPSLPVMRNASPSSSVPYVLPPVPRFGRPPPPLPRPEDWVPAGAAPLHPLLGSSSNPSMDLDGLPIRSSHLAGPMNEVTRVAASFESRIRPFASSSSTKPPPAIRAPAFKPSSASSNISAANTNPATDTTISSSARKDDEDPDDFASSMNATGNKPGTARSGPPGRIKIGFGLHRRGA